MILRYRWFRLGASGTKSVCGRFAEQALPKVEGGWFVRVQLPDGATGFRYVWESTVVVNRLGNLGDVESEAVPTMASIYFSLIPLATEKSLLRVVEPGRNVRPLLDALGQVFGFGFTCSPIALGDLPRLSILDDVDSARLVGLKLTDVAVASNVVARMEFASVSGMKDADLAFVSRRAHKREEIAYDLTYRGVKGRLSYSARGLVRIGGALASRILKLVERDIVLLQSQRSR